MSRATASPEIAGARRRRLPRLLSLGAILLVYSLYPAAVCAAIAAGRPRLALAATCATLGVFLVILPRRRGLGIVLLAAAILLLLSTAATIPQPLVFAPPVVINLALAVVFGRTLTKGREPLISTFARAERGTLEPDLAKYTRKLTSVWVAFFISAAALSALLAAIAPPAVWGWFVAVGNQAGVGLLFIGEYYFRQLRFPHYRHASPFALAGIVMRQWRQPSVRQ